MVACSLQGLSQQSVSGGSSAPGLSMQCSVLRCGRARLGPCCLLVVRALYTACLLQCCKLPNEHEHPSTTKRQHEGSAASLAHAHACADCASADSPQHDQHAGAFGRGLSSTPPCCGIHGPGRGCVVCTSLRTAQSLPQTVLLQLRMLVHNEGPSRRQQSKTGGFPSRRAFALPSPLATQQQAGGS